MQPLYAHPGDQHVTKAREDLSGATTCSHPAAWATGLGNLPMLPQHWQPAGVFLKHCHNPLPPIGTWAHRLQCWAVTVSEMVSLTWCFKSTGGGRDTSDKALTPDADRLWHSTWAGDCDGRHHEGIWRQSTPPVLTSLNRSARRPLAQLRALPTASLSLRFSSAKS